jgi:hypothetical protein
LPTELRVRDQDDALVQVEIGDGEPRKGRVMTTV